jgi:hypothetical protein
MMKLILYTKPGCHLCEGLLEKLKQVKAIELTIEERDITSNGEWFELYQYEIPVLYRVTADSDLVIIPRFSPRAPVAQIEKQLAKWI